MTRLLATLDAIRSMRTRGVLFSLGPLLRAIRSAFIMGMSLYPFTSELTRGVKQVDDRVIVKIGTQTALGGRVGGGCRRVVH
jgi:hypothetical protein